MKFRAISRIFFAPLTTFCALCLAICAFSPAFAQQSLAQPPLKIALAAPLTGSYAPIGMQMREGVEAALANSGLSNSALLVVDTQCTAEAASAISTILVKQNISLVIGFACSEALNAALDIFGPAGIPIITPVNRDIIIAERAKRDNWPLFRLAPRSNAERAALKPLLMERLAPELFAIIDDGTIYGRELAEGFRIDMEENQLKPVYIDNFRPQMDNQIGLVGRLKKSGATHVFAAGDYEDIAIIARDSVIIDYDVEIIGGEALRAAPITATMPDGVLMVAPILWRELALAAPTITALQAQGIEPDGYVLPSYAALQIAMQSHNDDLPARANLHTGTFPTALGTIRFDDTGTMTLNPYALHIAKGGQFERLP